MKWTREERKQMDQKTRKANNDVYDLNIEVYLQNNYYLNHIKRCLCDIFTIFLIFYRIIDIRNIDNLSYIWYPDCVFDTVIIYLIFSLYIWYF